MLHSGSRRPQHPLARLALFTNLAEIGQAADGPWKPEASAVWVKKVESRKDFLFLAPLWRRFTQDRDLDPAAVAEFKAGLRPLLLARRLGALILEFPWAFAFTRENRDFLLQLRRTFYEYPLAAEFRHDSWLRDEAFTTLVQCRLGFVNIDQPAYFRAMPPSALLTSGLAVVRLHGRTDPHAFQEFGAPLPGCLYDSDELAEWMPRIRQLAGSATRVLVSFTSGGGARSLANALELREMLGEKELRAPAGLLERFPAELAGFRPERPVQRNLMDVSPVRTAA
jgi:uncharacterized protein YecE (DUF72 family)